MNEVVEPGIKISQTHQATEKLPHYQNVNVRSGMGTSR